MSWTAFDAHGGGAFIPTPSGGVRLSPGAHRLLTEVESGTSFEALARTATAQGRPATPEQVEQAYRRIRAAVDQARATPAQSPPGYWARIRLADSDRVDLVARWGAYAFHPVVAAPLVAVVIAAVVASALRSVEPVASDTVPATALLLLALVAHELGHASACRRYGARPGEIGFLMYLVLPALYSNVTAAWALRRWQRVVVDLGGVYFELLFGVGCELVYQATGWTPARAVQVGILASVLTTMNPVLRFDGYWLLADALGVPNLDRQAGRLRAALWDRIRGGSARLPWSRATSAAVVGYTAASTAVFVVFAVRLFAWLPTVARGVPDHLRQVLAEPGVPSLATVASDGWFFVVVGLWSWMVVRQLAHGSGARG